MITGYLLRVNGGAYSDFEIDVGLVYTYDITGLTEGTEYGFQLAAYDEHGIRSGWSATVYKTPSSPFMLLDDDGNALLDDEGNALITYF